MERRKSRQVPGGESRIGLGRDIEVLPLHDPLCQGATSRLKAGVRPIQRDPHSPPPPPRSAASLRAIRPTRPRSRASAGNPHICQIYDAVARRVGALHVMEFVEAAVAGEILPPGNLLPSTRRWSSCFHGARTAPLELAPPDGHHAPGHKAGQHPLTPGQVSIVKSHRLRRPHETPFLVSGDSERRSRRSAVSPAVHWSPRRQVRYTRSHRPTLLDGRVEVPPCGGPLPFQGLPRANFKLVISSQIRTSKTVRRPSS